jgi:hypothetical protein
MFGSDVSLDAHPPSVNMHTKSDHPIAARPDGLRPGEVRGGPSAISVRINDGPR